MSRSCGVCGAAAPPPYRAPAPELAPDLDMRPGEPTRSTLPLWVQVCGECGAAAPDLAALGAASGAVVRGAKYRQVQAEPPSAAPFLRWAILADADQRPEALLQAAWMADDAGADAAPLRRAAAAAWGAASDAQGALRLVDVLRRAGAFDAASARADALSRDALDENSTRILEFQRARIAARDAGRHLLSSALRPPARMPHVAHGRRREPAGKGFWGRLLSR